MRDFLTGVAIILIVVLTTILVAPYFVDWTGQRGFLEARLSHALGQKVTIGGAIDLKLLPTPYLVLDQVVVGGDDGPFRIGVHHLDLELTVAPLLHGEFDIVEARLEEPTIRVALTHDRTLPAWPTAPAFQADVRFDRIQVSDGTLAIADPVSGRTFVFDHLDLDADAGSFTGPFKVRGAEGPEGQRTKFHLTTATAQSGRARARLVVEETPAHAALEVDGTITLAGASPDTMRESFDGTLVVSGHLPPDADDPIAWKLSGPFKADPLQAALDGGELRLGGEDAGLTLQVTANAQLGDQPTLALDVSAKQLDLDRLSGAPVDAVKPPPPKLPDVATLRRILAAAHPPVPTLIDVAIDNATYGGETLSGLQAHFGLGDKARQPLKLSGDGPGGTHVALDGLIDTGTTDPTFAGTVDAEADNLPRAVDWLGGVAPALSWRGSDLPFKSVKLGGRVEASAGGIGGNTLAMTLDRSTFSGAMHVTYGTLFGVGSEPTKVVADLRSEALDLDGLPSLDALQGGSNRFDFALHLDANALKVSRFGDGALEAGHIQVQMEKTGRHFALQGLHIDDLGGATIQAAGLFDPERGSLAVNLDAAHLEMAAALARQLAPGALTDALVARAAAFAPAKLNVTAALTPKAGGGLAPSQFAVTGTLGATRIVASAAPDPGGADVVAISASLDSADGGVVLSQLGIPSLPMDTIGPSHFSLSAKGKAGARFATTFAATLGATKLDVTGSFDLLSAVPSGTGTLKLQSPDLTPLLQSLAIAFPDMTGRIPAEVAGILAVGETGATLGDLKGRVGGIGTRGTLRYTRSSGDDPALTGALNLDRLTLPGLLGLALGPPQTAGADAVWSREPLGVGLIDPPRGVISLKAKTLELGPGLEATNASMALGIAPNVVTLGQVTADLSGGRIEGGVTLRRDGRQATVEGKVRLDHVALHRAALETRLTATLDVAGGGTSALGLVTSLAGSGEATAEGLSIPGGDPGALPKIFEDVETDALTVDQDAVIRAFGDAAKVPLSAGTRHFGLSLAAGVLHFDPKEPVAPEQGAVSSKIDAAFDLVQARLDQHVEETLNALPKNWAGPPPSIVLTLSGPLNAPQRSLDVSGFLNAVAARALARETARIEAYEFDIRERAIFNARLQSERRREEDKQKAEDDARKAAAKAEADRKARLEAVRLERARKEAAEKAAAETEAAEKAARAPSPDHARPPDPAPADPSTLGRY